MWGAELIQECPLTAGIGGSQFSIGNTFDVPQEPYCWENMEATLTTGKTYFVILIQIMEPEPLGIRAKGQQTK